MVIPNQMEKALLNNTHKLLDKFMAHLLILLVNR